MRVPQTHRLRRGEGASVFVWLVGLAVRETNVCGVEKKSEKEGNSYVLRRGGCVGVLRMGDKKSIVASSSSSSHLSMLAAFQTKRDEYAAGRNSTTFYTLFCPNIKRQMCVCVCRAKNV